MSAEDRFWAKVDTTGDCWEWQAARTHDGYGVFTAPVRKKVRAHRFAYEILVGPIPAGLEIDHLCRVRHCVNPAHLEAVTRQEHWRRGESFAAQNARKTHCKHGHEFTPENTYHYRTGRECRACRALAARRAYWATVAALAYVPAVLPASTGETP